MTSDTQHTDGGSIEHDRLRRLEAVALLATVAAVGLTALLEPATAAVESNPVAQSLLETLGWTGAGLVAVGLEAALFAGWRRLAARGYRRTALVAGGGIAAVGVVDVLVNLHVLVEVGVPATARWAHYAGLVAPVALLAGVLLVRPDPRRVLSTGRGVTSRLSTVERQHIVALAAGLMLVTSSLGGVAGPLSAVQPASAAGTEDFEDGSIDDPEGDTASFEIASDRPFEGSNAGRLTPNNNIVGVEFAQFSNTTPSKASFFFQYNEFVNGSAYSTLRIQNESGNQAPIIQIGSNGGIYHFDGGSRTYSGSNISKDTYYKVEWTDLDYSADTATVTIESKNGGTIFTRDITSLEDMSSIEEVDIQTRDDAQMWVDYATTGDSKSFGVEVDGTISNSNGGAIDGATVELRQSGSVVKSTTTNSSGGYKFSGVSDGDYTLRASASGYQNTSKTITVAGSPVTVNLSLFESGTFERTFQIDDPAQQTYPPTKSELSVYRWSTALEFPLPGGTTFRAGPGTWEHVATTQFNGFGQADVRVEDGAPYRAEVVATSGDRSTRWESLGWRADKDRDDPFVISLGSATDSSTPTATTAPTGTPTGTSTHTPTPEELGTPTATDGTGINGGGQAPTDPFDKDGDGDFFDDPAENDSTRSPTVAGANTGFGPRLAGSCLLADGTQGVLIEFWDPAYETSALTYNISHGNSSYAGERTFETPAGYATWCVADAVTANASEQRADLTGNYTQNGTTINYSDSLSQSAVFGGPLGGGGGSSGEPSTGQRAVGIGLSAGVGYLLVRRFTEFRLSAALGTVVSRARSLVGGGGS